MFTTKVTNIRPIVTDCHWKALADVFLNDTRVNDFIIMHQPGWEPKVLLPLIESIDKHGNSPKRHSIEFKEEVFKAIKIAILKEWQDFNSPPACSHCKCKCGGRSND